VRWRRESRLALGLALGVALLLGIFLPGAEGAGPRKKGAQQRARIVAQSHRALLSLYALDSRLLQTRSELAGLRSRADGLRLERDRVQQEVDVIAGNVKTSQRLLGERLRALYEEAYAGEPFVELADRPPGMRDVRDTNVARIHVRADERTGKAFAFCVIDNLWKGASSQAVQNLNLMLGLPETLGLDA